MSLALQLHRTRIKRLLVTGARPFGTWPCSITILEFSGIVLGPVSLALQHHHHTRVSAAVGYFVLVTAMPSKERRARGAASKAKAKEELNNAIQAPRGGYRAAHEASVGDFDRELDRLQIALFGEVVPVPVREQRQGANVAVNSPHLCSRVSRDKAVQLAKLAGRTGR